MIKFENVNVTMQGKRILSDINLEIQDGEFVLICGESGCGKTTMTKLINGLIPHFVRDVSVDGTITVCGKNVAEMPMYEIAELVGSVFQNPRTQFFYTNSNAEMAFGLENRGVEPEYIRKRIKNTINELDIEKLEDRDVFSMSGGEKQLLAFASVYAMNPQIYVLDEPSANLDIAAMEKLSERMKVIKKKGHTVVVAEHRLAWIQKFADRIIYMKEGRIEQEFTSDEFKALSDLRREQMGLRSIIPEQIQIPEITVNSEDAVLQVCNLSGKRKKQMIFENTHEAIVDRQAWEKAHEAFEKPKRAKAENADSNFKDFVFCARCGAPMSNLHHAQHLKTGTICYYDFFICSTYRKSEHLEERQCVQNAFSAKALRPLLKETIQTVSRYALTNQEEFLARLQREMLAEQPEQTKQLKKGIAAKNKRVAELDRLLKKLYENYALEKIPEERFDALSAEYESEQTQLEKAVLEEQRQLDEIQSGEDKIEQFMALVECYRDCTEYSDEVLRQFVEKVIVHETVKDEDGERSREIEVYLNFIGKFDVPMQLVELSPEEQKRQAALKKRRIHQRNKRAQARQERMNAQLKNESPI